MKIENRYYYTVNCTHCGKEYLRQSTRKDKRYFCTHNCWRQQLLKENDPKGYHILENIDTPNFCYLIGLICTDGHINIRDGKKDNCGNTCRIQLAKSSLYLLENIQQFFGGYIIKKSQRTAQYPIWHIGNKMFNEYLINVVGLTQNKTLTLNIRNWFNLLTDINKNHFIRGVIDGDGSISISNNSRGYNDYKVYITSASVDFLKMLQEYLSVGNIIDTKSKAKNLVICSKKAVDVLVKVYDISVSNLHHVDKFNKFQILRKKYV